MKKLFGVLVLLVIVMVACGSEETPTPQVQIITDVPTSTVTPRPPTATPTGTPTPLAVPTLPPTPRQVVVSRFSDTVDPTSNVLLEEGQPVPPIVLTDIDGNRYQLDQLGGRVVVINFWTVGCGSCFYEFPLLQEIHESVAEDEVLILAVNVSDLAEETRYLAENLGVTYPMLVDPQGEIFATFFGGAVVPTTYFIGADGLVYDAVVGPMDMFLLTNHLQEMGVVLASVG